MRIDLFKGKNCDAYLCIDLEITNALCMLKLTLICNNSYLDTFYEHR